MSDDTATDIVSQRIAQLMIEYFARPTQEEKDRDLRNWYAGLAMQGYMAREYWSTSTQENTHITVSVVFSLADAMLRASKEPPK